MKYINFLITDKDLNFLLSVLDNYVFINMTENDKENRKKLKKIYDKLNKEYLKNE